MELTSLQLDLLKEAFNMGAGVAASSLEKLTGGGEEHKLSVPEVTLMPLARLNAQMTVQGGNELCGVVQAFEGPVAGSAVLLCSQDEGAGYVRALLGEETPGEITSAMRGDALLEMGNIILGGCLSGVGDMLQREFRTRAPVFHEGRCVEIFERAGYDPLEDILYLRIRFTLSEKDLAGHMGLSIEVDSQDQLREILESYLTEAFDS